MKLNWMELTVSSSVVFAIGYTAALLWAQPHPCGSRPPEAPIGGPFRPRPKPPEPPKPEPIPDLPDLDVRERRLFERLKTMLESRDERMAKRQEEYSQWLMVHAFNGLADDLEAYDPDNPKVQGPFSGMIVSALWEFCKKAAKVVFNALIVGALLGLLYLYWPWVAGAAVFIVGLFRLWVGAIVSKAVKP